MGDGSLGDIALDDLRLAPGGACPKVDPEDRKFDCGDGQKIPAIQHCNWIQNECKNGEPNFERKLDNDLKMSFSKFSFFHFLTNSLENTDFH